MRRRFFAFSVLIHTCLFAQEPLTVDMLVPDKAIKVSPLHLLNFYPTVELSYEQKILPKFTTQVEIGYVLNYGSNNDEAFQNKRGVKLKWETRYYFDSIADLKRMYYAAIEPYMNVINFDRYHLLLECFDLECNNQYLREYNSKMKYREQGVSLKAGVIRYLGSGFFLDFNSGLTLRNIGYDEPEPQENDVSTKDTWTFIEIPNEEDRIGLSPNLGIRLAYRLK